MARKNFFELLEREIDFQKEYEKIEDAIINEKYMLSLEAVIEKDFSDWPFRGNFISFWELRCHLGFTYTESDVYGEDYEPDRKHIKMDDFLLYSEMMLNDGIFQQGLMLFLTIEQAKRTKEIAGFKAALNEK